MPIEQNSKVKLVRREDEAFAFTVVDADTGRPLSEAEAKARMPKQPEPKAAARPKAGDTRALAAAPLRLCGEGDSWINLLNPISGFPKTFFDVLGATFATVNIAFPGDTLDDVLATRQYVQKLSSGQFRVFILSGGGNDILGGGGLANLLKGKSEGHGSTDPADYVKAPQLKAALKKLRTGYRVAAKEAKTAEESVVMLIHGYDYVIPRRNGKWLGKPLKAAGFTHDEPLAGKITGFLVDSFNELLRAVAGEFPHVRYVNVRKTVQTLWHDELHPTTAGAKKVAKLFEAEINRLQIS